MRVGREKLVTHALMAAAIFQLCCLRNLPAVDLSAWVTPVNSPIAVFCGPLYAAGIVAR